MRWEGSGASTTQSPWRGVTGPQHLREAGSLGRGKVPEAALPAPLSGQALPGLVQGGRPGRSSSLLPWGASPARAAAASGFQGLTKWPPRPAAISCLRQAAALADEEGG